MLMTLPAILSPQDILEFNRALEQAPWEAGHKTAGSRARNVKSNQQLSDQHPIAQDLGRRILQRLGQHPRFISAALPQRIYPPKFNRYSQGGAYGTHVDNALMPLPGRGDTLRSDLSATLFLSDPESYEGGVLQIETAFGAQEVKLAAGELVLYPASSLHQVTPVTQGTRLAAIFWIQSHIQQDDTRALLFDLDQAIQALHTQIDPASHSLTTLTAVYHNLLRRFAQS